LRTLCSWWRLKGSPKPGKFTKSVPKLPVSRLSAISRTHLLLSSVLIGAEGWWRCVRPFILYDDGTGERVKARPLRPTDGLFINQPGRPASGALVFGKWDDCRTPIEEYRTARPLRPRPTVTAKLRAQELIRHFQESPKRDESDKMRIPMKPITVGAKRRWRGDFCPCGVP